ncbi:coiled-coil domain-containing protein 97 [Fopius arisanus]|uniref:Coiled-coil domain-containing protein 97 n=1 Tax=Fopius arisanus TaxID=64838 RepID=A0A9R1TXV4_9HYME|nr:PREDICTED: coiled-coil domain-containing protein 97 [Fopius arisanus]
MRTNDCPETITTSSGGKSVENISNDDNSLELTKNPIEDEILDTVANSPAIFKSQLQGDAELSLNEKRKIAEELLRRNHHQFLSRFGKNLRPHLLDYFTEKSNDYETNYHVGKLRRYLNTETRKIDRKNRRYEALKEMLKKGEYFSETAMMKRNPLLYEHLIGRFLTEEQKRVRDNLDTKNITFVNLLLESIEREGLRELKRAQEEAEEEVIEENDSDEEDLENRGNNWGEIAPGGEGSYEGEGRDRRRLESRVPEQVDTQEQMILRQEFVSQMYESFLEGRDTDFDYSTIDDNESYDNVDLREQDEEERYFDAESPEITTSSPKNPQDEESEDELDKYMRSLKGQESEETATEKC